ncbi:MAG: hypothetical protein AAF799_29975 [Myxococcota bacterium]
MKSVVAWSVVILAGCLGGCGRTDPIALLDASMPDTGGEEGESTTAADSFADDSNADTAADTGPVVTTTPPPPVTTTDPGGEVDTGPMTNCGNAVIEFDELCDGPELGGEDCVSQGFGDGVLLCTDDCLGFDPVLCEEPSCGNGILEGEEACDGTDLGGVTCEDLGFGPGIPNCTIGCTGFDVTPCIGARCGDGIVHATEVCDGLDLKGETCVSQGFDGGVLSCAAGCQDFEYGNCFQCGDGFIDPGEVCDGADLGGNSCLAQGFDGGALACASDCGGFDITGCISLTCGNDLIDGAEVCDGPDLAGQDCASLGLGTGELACDAGCTSLDTSGCLFCVEEDIGTATGPGVATGNTDLEDDDLPQSCAAGGSADRVLLFTATDAGDYAFDTNGSDYDTALTAFASCDPGSQLACDDDGGTGTDSRIVVDLAAGQSVLIVVDGWSGSTGDWILNIEPPSLP